MEDLCEEGKINRRQSVPLDSSSSPSLQLSSTNIPSIVGIFACYGHSVISRGTLASHIQCENQVRHDCPDVRPGPLRPPCCSYKDFGGEGRLKENPFFFLDSSSPCVLAASLPSGTLSSAFCKDSSQVYRSTSRHTRSHPRPN